LPILYLYNRNIEEHLNLNHKKEEPQMQSWRVEAARIVKQTIQAEGLSVEEAASRFSVRPTRIRRILAGEYTREVA
jgi:ribosome-binding protein aMBF1 (putative translation factor)